MKPLSVVKSCIEPGLWFVGMLLLWEAAVVLLDVSALVVPPPSVFLMRLVEDYELLFRNGFRTVRMIALGFFFGAVPGILLGYLIANSQTAERILYPMAVLIQGLPKITLAPLMLVWFGFTDFPKIFLTALITFFPILVDSIHGFKSVDPRHYYLSKSTGSSRWQTFLKFQLPTALPSIFSGAKITIVIAVTVVIIVEWLNSKDGLGHVVLLAMRAHDVALVFAALVVGSLIGVFLLYCITLLETVVTPWRRR